MVNFGCRGHDMTKARTPEGLGAALEAQGVRNVQLALARSFPEMPCDAAHINPGMGSRIRRALAEHGVEIAVLGCYFNMIDPDLKAREAGIRRFEAHLANAPSFGARIVASETGSVDPAFAYTEKNFTDSAYRDAEAVIARLVRTAERIGVVVGIEPGVNHPIHDVATTRRLLDAIDSPCLGVVLDPTALITPADAPRQLDIVRDALDAFGDRVVASHLVDYRIEAGAAGPALVRCNLGEGELDAGAVLDMLCAARPQGYVITEFTEDDAVGQAVRVLGAGR